MTDGGLVFHFVDPDYYVDGSKIFDFTPEIAGGKVIAGYDSTGAEVLWTGEGETPETTFPGSSGRTYISAVQSTSTANVVFITALIPVATAALSWIFLNERVHLFTWIATALSLLGVALIAGDSVSLGWQSAQGDLYAIISCLCSAACFTIVAASGKNVATSLGVGSLFSAIFALVFLGPVFTGPGALDANAWFWASLSGLIVVPAASILLSNGPRFLPSSDVSMFFLLETTLTPLWTFLIFTEIPRGNVMIGGAIVIVTLLIHSYWRLSASLKLNRAVS